MNKFTTQSLVIYLIPVGLITIVLIVLKLLSVITWSWVWVLSPVWIYYSLGALFFMILYVYLIWDEKRQHKQWLIHLQEMKNLYGDDEGIEVQKKLDDATLAK